MSNLTPKQLSYESYMQTAYVELSKDFEKGINPFSLPKITKVSVNVGVGRMENKDKQEVFNSVMKLVNQKPRMQKSKVSIASFKLKKNDVVGVSATLRGKKMYDFLLNLIYLALPRTRDFKGVKESAFNSEFSCYSLGLESAAIFPTVGFDSAVNFGMQINIVFKDPSQENKKLLLRLGFPFKKD
jgi:large subunit ribosomal protein L5